MDKVFLLILNMSLTASFVIVVVCLARVFLRRAPKVISYALWAVVPFNLVCPFKFESAFSLIPFKAQAIPTDITIQAVPRINSGIAVFTTDNNLKGIKYTDSDENHTSIFYIFGAETDSTPYYFASVSMNTQVFEEYKFDIEKVMKSFKVLSLNE